MLSPVILEHDEEMSRITDDYGRTLLHSAITSRKEDFAEYLIKERGTKQPLTLVTCLIACSTIFFS